MNKQRWRPTVFLSFSIALHLLALLAVVIDFALWPWALAAVAANHIVITALGLLPRSSGLGANWTRLPDAASNSCTTTSPEGAPEEFADDMLPVPGEGTAT